LSYDLLVFDPAAVPIDREAFLAWYDSRDMEAELFDPTQSEFSTPNLRSWLDDMLQTFPALNGPYSKIDQDWDDPHFTEYDINKTNIYACFAWSLAESAYNAVLSLAEKHRVAVFDVSGSEGRVWYPGNDGRLY
jgi:hypothetical protein